jgi:hypothetical protein
MNLIHLSAELPFKHIDLLVPITQLLQGWAISCKAEAFYSQARSVGLRVECAAVTEPGCVSRRGALTAFEDQARFSS